MIIPLNIVREYPVNWDFPTILRDLIQNFYDEIGYDNFFREFRYEWKEEGEYVHLSMATKDHSFSYEWLTYIGGSTKTGNKTCVGMYGEGFKICMLCLLRDFNLVPRMESQDWSLIPCWEERTIGESTQSTLAYDLCRREDNGETTLTIEKIPIDYLEAIQSGMLDFYYPENPLIGRMICRRGDYMIHERSDMPIPCAQWDGKLKGIYFESFLARGRLPFPLVIINQKGMSLPRESRKRRTLYPFEVNGQVYYLTMRMEPADSYQMPMAMKEFWNDLPKEKEDIYTWYFVINQLVRNVSRSEEYSSLFLQENSNLVYVDRIGLDKQKDRIIENAQRWARECDDKRKKVNPIFRLLRVPSLVEEYQKSELEMYRKPVGTEVERCRILQSVVKTAFEDMFDTGCIPDIILLKQGKKNLGALVFAEKCYGKKTHNKCRIPYKYMIKKAVIEERYMADDSFEDALMEYVDILCHCFGTDKNMNVNGMLTECGARLIQFEEAIQNAREEWRGKTDNAGI